MNILLRPRPSSRLRELTMPFVAVAASLAICSFLILIAGANPLRAFSIMFSAAFGGQFEITETLVRAAPMVLTGLAALVALRAKFWNIGGEGQLLVGAMAAAYIGTLEWWPVALLVPGMLMAAAMAGAILCAVPACLKMYLRVDEVVTTLMLNFIVMFLLAALLSGPWKDPVSGWTDSPDILRAAEFPILIQRTSLHLGVLVALIATIVIGVVMKYSTFGFSIRVTGENPKAAHYAGWRLAHVIILVALLSGALAGLAGAGEVGGVQFQVIGSISAGYGYAGLVVAMLARLSAIGVIPAAIFLAGIGTGADEMSRQTGVPFFIADAVQGISLIAVLIAMTLASHRLVVIRGSKTRSTV